MLWVSNVMVYGNKASRVTYETSKLSVKKLKRTNKKSASIEIKCENRVDYFLLFGWIFL